jgi:predicted phosphodiesterase
VLVGDNLDLPELSKYRLSPRFRDTTQATIDRTTTFAAELRAAAGPDASIKWLAGNHEERLPNYITDNATAAFGLRKGNSPDDWPILTVPFLCRLDEHDIEFLPGYPANKVWINERLKVVHGHKVSQGSTAHTYLASERVSIIYGHIHRREWAEQTRDTHEGKRTILAMSPGCLCRTDGRVPSTKGGVDHDGIPVEVTENWQQGVLVVTYEEGDGRFIPEQVPIHDGWAMWRGREITA